MGELTCIRTTSKRGSSLWNGVLTYVLRVKDLKSIDLKNGQATIITLQEQINQLRADIQLKEQVLKGK